MNICKKCGKQIISLIPEEKCYCNETYATNHTEIVYQEALNYQKSCWHMKLNTQPNLVPSHLEKSYNVLQEAISKAEKYDEKETGKKLVEKTKKKILLGEEHYEKSYHCPSCDSEFVFTPINYCPDCGQKLDWSE